MEYDFQVALYELILETNKECVKLCRPGISIQQIHNFSVCFREKHSQNILGPFSTRKDVFLSF